MGKHLLPKADITKLNDITWWEVTELTSWTVEETAFAILKRQGSWVITIVSSQRNLICNIQVDPYWPKWETKCSKLASKNIYNPEMHQDTCNRYRMIGFASAHIPWNPISNMELQQSCEVLWSDLVLPCATTINTIFQSVYAQTMDANKKQLPSPNTCSIAMDRWKMMNKLALKWVIAYNKDPNWVLGEVQPACDEVDPLFFSGFES